MFAAVEAFVSSFDNASFWGLILACFDVRRHLQLQQRQQLQYKKPPVLVADVCGNIVSWLPLWDKLRLSQTSRLWEYAVRHDNCWEALAHGIVTKRKSRGRREV